MEKQPIDEKTVFALLPAGTGDGDVDVAARMRTPAAVRRAGRRHGSRVHLESAMTPRDDAWLLDNGINVVLFAGLGGACDGLERAGLPVHVAINHDKVATAVHQHRHPHTKHYQRDVHDVDPLEAMGGRPVNILWASPDCRHFSPAKGGALVSNRIRSLPWVICRWLGQAQPLICFTENVKQIRTWGPLVAKRDTATGRVIKVDGSIAAPGERVPVQLQALIPCRKRRGRTYRLWVRHNQGLGYEVRDWDLVCADFGVPTTRERFFAVMRRDGSPIVRPVPTHAPAKVARARGLKPWVSAATCIDWSIPFKSIFNRPRPPVEATLRRIARGTVRYVIQAAKPFIIPVTHSGDSRVHDIDDPLRTQTTAHRGEFAVVSAFLSRYYGKSIGSDMALPLSSQTQGCHDAVTAAWTVQHNTGLVGRPAADPVSIRTQGIGAAHLVKLRGTARDGQPATKPAPALSAQGNHIGLVSAFLIKYYSSGGQDQAADQPLGTATCKARFGVVTVKLRGALYAIADLGMRMLEPEEAAAAHGLADAFPTLVKIDGKYRPLTKQEKTSLVGNSVPPRMAEVLARANPVQALLAPSQAAE